MKYIYISIILLLSFRITNGQVTRIGEPFLEGAVISDICGNSDELWVATYGRGIYQYVKKDNTWINFSTNKNNLTHDFFYCITSNKNYVWAGSSDGLFTYDKKRQVWLKRKFGKGGELGNWIRSIAYDKDLNVVWIGRFKYLTKYDIAANKYTDYDLTIGSDVKTNNIKTIKLDGDSLVWFGTEVGVHKYNKSKDLEDINSRQFLNIKNGYFNVEGDAASLADMIFEPKDIWVGLDEFVTSESPNFNLGGVYLYDRKTVWERIDRPTTFPGRGVFCMEKVGNAIWISIYDFNQKKKEQVGQGLVLVDRTNKSIKRISKDELNISSDKITTMLFDGENMWLGTESGLVRIAIVNKLAQITK
jgi:ligand-binding sensor domain-containing protein